MGKMTLQQMITQLAGGMAVSTDFCDHTAIFTSVRTRDRVRAYVEEQADQTIVKVYISIMRHAADAATHGGVFWTVLSVPHQSRQRLPSCGYLHRFCH